MIELQHAIAAQESEEIASDEDLDSPKSILSSCVRLMRLSKSDQRVPPFVECEARFYGYHARNVEERCVPELRQFVENRMLREGSWQVLHFAYNVQHAIGKDIFAGLPNNASILYVASYWGFHRLLGPVLNDSEALCAHSLISINGQDSHGWTPLNWAASMREVDVAKFLLHFGAAVNSLDSARWTPLFWAAIKVHHELTGLFLY